MRFLLALFVTLGLTIAPATVHAQSFTCTLVLGFSQTNQWYTGATFEPTVGSDGWEMIYDDGASIDHYGDPNDPVWALSPVSPCVANASAPDRIVLNISGSYSADVEGWVSDIQAAINVIRVKYPSVQQIVLLPVVGGPAGYSQCVDPGSGQIVRASYNAPYIAQAIDILVTADVYAGPHPEVAQCADYADAIGHLTDLPVFNYVGQFIADWFVGTAPGPPTPTPTPTPGGPTDTPTPLPTDTPTPSPTPTQTPTPSPTPAPAYVRRFDTGATADYTGSDGRVWAADVAWTDGGCGYIGGGPFATYIPVAGTADDDLYHTTRIDLTGFEYRCDVPNGTYRIVMEFAELVPANYAAGNRLFNVAIEGTTVLTSFDVYNEAGPATALTKEFSVNIIDGQVNIVFTAVAGRAMIGGLELSNLTYPTPTPTATPLPATATPTPTPTPGPSPTPIPCRIEASVDGGPVTLIEVNPSVCLP